MKHIINCILIICCVFCFSTLVYANEAENLIKTANITTSFGATSSITDSNRSTKANIKGDGEIKIEILAPAHSLYLVWDKYPTAWQLEAEGEIIATSNEYKMLHEYVLTPNVSMHTSLTLKVSDGTLCDVYAFGEGEVPSYVQQWQAPYDDADMLLIPSHADDEHLYFGGTMPYYSQDKKLQVAYFTVHSGEIYRQHELLDGLYTVGIRAYPVFSSFSDYYADSIEQAKGLYKEADAIDFIAQLIRRFKPEVLIGHDVNGEYGHGVHKYNTYCLQKALPIAADTHQVLKTYLHLYEENPIVMDWSVALDFFEGKTALDMAIEGFAKHKSQQTYFKVEASGPYDCRKFGLYDTQVGVDVNKNDFFENIDETMYSDYVTPPPPPVDSEPIQQEPSQSQLDVINAEIEQVNAQQQKYHITMAVVALALALLSIIGIMIIIKIKNKK